MKRLLILCSRPLARFHLWRAVVVALYLAGPFAGLDAASLGRLSYALMMSRGSRATQRVFLRMLRRELDRSAAGNGVLAMMAQRLGRTSLAASIYRRTARNSVSMEDRRLAEVMAEVTGALASGAMDSRVAALVEELGLEAREPVVLITASGRHVDLFGLWLEQARKHMTGRIAGIALDLTSQQALAAALDGLVVDLSPYMVFSQEGVIADRSKNALWVLRVFVLRELVARGHAVTSIDLDAIALGDVSAMLRGFPDVDIVAQQDYSIPVDVARRLGFVLCCGFMVFYPTPATQAFLARYVEETMLELDDQLAINHRIGRAKIENKIHAEDHFRFVSDGVRWLCPDKRLVSRDLRSGSVVRHFQQQGQTVAELRTELGLKDG